MDANEITRKQSQHDVELKKYTTKFGRIST